MTHIEELIGKGKKQISMADVAIESVAPYAVADAENTLRLMPLEEKELERVNGKNCSKKLTCRSQPFSRRWK
jgi:DNA polymerase-1